jgi:hypothetical protein
MTRSSHMTRSLTAVCSSSERLKMDSFMLTGDGIEVRYSTTDGVLSVKGDGLRGSERNFSGDKLRVSVTDLGTLLTGTLLESDRGGNQTRLYVLVPSAIRWHGEGSESLVETISGVAIIVTDRTRSVRKKGATHDFEVRQLSGTMQNLNGNAVGGVG